MVLRKFKVILILLLLFFLILTCYFLISGYYSAQSPISYLPEIHSIDDALKSKLSHNQLIELKTPWYVLSADESGSLSVTSTRGEMIMSGLTHYSEYENSEGIAGLKNLKISLINDSTISICGEGSFGITVNESATIHKHIPRIDFQVTTHYNSDITVRREALICKFEVPASEVYLKNRKIDNEPSDSEYWLERQGVRFGSRSRSCLIYHTPDISSLQLNSEKNLLFINLEYSLDHPHIQIPYQEDGKAKWINVSSAKYSEGDSRNNDFSFYFGCIPEVTPRLMLVPYGNLAGYVFTEHADGGNIRTHRAAYFGSGNISDIEVAKGGFAGYKIPVTKSIFFADSIGRLSDTTKTDNEWHQFLDFLDQLNETGLYDICLHTPEYLNSNRQMLEESIKFMKERFDTRTWIDHGMYSGKNNRESFVCDMFNHNSELYSADLMDKYDVRYFWNPAVEEIRKSSVSYLSEEIKKLRFINASATLWKRYFSPDELEKMGFLKAFPELIKRYSFDFELNSLLPDRGQAFPTPLYWQHPTYTDEFYSWVTDYVKFYKITKTDKVQKRIFKNEEYQLKLLLNNWGVFINHGYFVRDMDGNDILSADNGEIVVNPTFDKILGLMDNMRDEGNLHLTTIRDLLDYWILVENIVIDFMPNGDMLIHNMNDNTVKGFSMALNTTGTVTVDSKIPQTRRIGDDTIVWFDLPSNGNLCMRIKQ